MTFETIRNHSYPIHTTHLINLYTTMWDRSLNIKPYIKELDDKSDANYGCLKMWTIGSGSILCYM
jgi:hypothetical protein